MADINISGEIGWEVNAKDIKEQFKDIKSTESVNIFINTPGGSIFQGIAISNIIKAHKGSTTTIVQGVAASMGAFLLMAGDVRKAHDDSSFMIHNALVEFIRGGDHRFLRKLANTLESLTNMLSKSFAKVTGKAVTEIRDMMDETTWLFGDEIKNAGFVDEIIETEDAENKEDALAFQKLAFDDCLSNVRKRDGQEEDTKELVAYFNQEPAKPPVKPQPKKEKMDEKKFLEYLGLNPEALAFYGTMIAAATATLPEGAAEPVDFANIKLEDFLAKAPVAKADHEQIVADAKIEVETGKLTKDIAVKVGNIISSDAYRASIKAAGIKVLTGEKDYSAFEDLVAVADENIEHIKSLNIQAAQPPGTPAEEHDLEGNTSVKSPKVQATVSTLKSQLNV